MKTVSILGEMPENASKKVIRSACHFLFGASFGLFFSMLVFSAITIAPEANEFKIIGLLLLIFCVPPGLIFMLLGFVGRGRLLHGLLRILNHPIDPNAG